MNGNARRIQLAVVGGLSLASSVMAGCSATYQTVSLPTAPSTPSAGGGVLRISESFSDDQRRDVEAAYGLVVSAIRDPVFLDFLSDKPTLSTSVSAGCEFIPPSRVAQLLIEYVEGRQPLQADRSFDFFKRYFRGVTATTGECHGTLFWGGVVDQWEAPAKAGYLVNTVAHEMTHLLPVRASDATPLDCRAAHTGFILDEGHTPCSAAKPEKPCSDAFLASYSFGDLVQCFYETREVSSQDDRRTAFDVCYEATVNSSRGFERSKLIKTSDLARCGQTASPSPVAPHPTHAGPPLQP